MNQQDYEVIVECIKFGSPALAPSLVNALHKVIENSNNYVEAEKAKREAEHKASIAVKETKAKDDGTVAAPKK